MTGSQRHPRLNRLALALSMMAGLTASAVAAPVAVNAVDIEESNDRYDLAVHYPGSGNAAIDAAIGGWASGLITGFVSQVNEDFASFAEEGDRPMWHSSLDLNYDVARNDDVLFVVDFNQSVFTGGAHPGHDIETFNFLMPDGWRVFLPEIFDPLAVERISELAIADLDRQWDGGSFIDDDWLNTGAGPEWENFREFLLLPDRLVIRFPTYQVAAYAAGAQEVSLPLSELEGLMRTDWRTPVPSFDCGKAGNATEDAICSDVALARLDRDMAGAYRASQRYAEDPEKTRTLDSQRAWLGTRNACGGDIACLTGAYRSRLAVLGPE